MRRGYLLALIVGLNAIQVECGVYNNCNITEIGPFLTEKCSTSGKQIILRCPNSKVTFAANTRFSPVLRKNYMMVSNIHARTI